MLKMTNVIYFDLYPEVIFDDDLMIDRGGNMLDFIVLKNQTCFFPQKMQVLVILFVMKLIAQINLFIN